MNDRNILQPDLLDFFMVDNSLKSLIVMVETDQIFKNLELKVKEVTFIDDMSVKLLIYVSILLRSTSSNFIDLQRYASCSEQGHFN